jgi:hypothetical protein
LDVDTGLINGTVQAMKNNQHELVVVVVVVVVVDDLASDRQSSANGKNSAKVRGFLRV